MKTIRITNTKKHTPLILELFKGTGSVGKVAEKKRLQCY